MNDYALILSKYQLVGDALLRYRRIEICNVSTHPGIYPDSAGWSVSDISLSDDQALLDCCQCVFSLGRMAGVG